MYTLDILTDLKGPRIYSALWMLYGEKLRAVRRPAAVKQIKYKCKILTYVFIVLIKFGLLRGSLLGNRTNII